MFDTNANPLSELLLGAAESLDIPNELYLAAATEYNDVGGWLSEHADRDQGWQVYPQGSILLGTVVQPEGRDEYDVDLVCLRSLERDQISQAELKEEVGDALRRYVTARTGDSGGPDGIESRKRCWTLTYERAFHLDVLPALPSEDGSATGILLTDRDLHHWQYSDPKGYAEWFNSRMALEFFAKRAELAEATQVDPEEIPEFEVRTTLQRGVQILKHHRNRFFADNLDKRPASILVTTLAAQAYEGEGDLLGALLGMAEAMPGLIERSGDAWMVANPVEPRENFADKWAKDPELPMAFHAWLTELRADLRAADDERGLPRVAARLSESLGSGPVEKAAQRLGDGYRTERERGTLGFAPATGALAGAGATKVKNHDFYGRRTD